VRVEDAGAGRVPAAAALAATCSNTVFVGVPVLACVATTPAWLRVLRQPWAAW